MADLFVTCRKCGAVNNYRVERKANNDVAYCVPCGAYIKNLPQGEPALFVGKYKGIPIKEVFDLDYLRWAERTLKMSANVRQATQAQISRLVNENR